MELAGRGPAACRAASRRSSCSRRSTAATAGARCGWATPGRGRPPRPSMRGFRRRACMGCEPTTIGPGGSGNAWRPCATRRSRPAPRMSRRPTSTLTLALLRYLADVRQGRASVRQISGVWKPAPGYPDPKATARRGAAIRPGCSGCSTKPRRPIRRMRGLLKARAAYEALIAAGREAPAVAVGRQDRAGWHVRAVACHRIAGWSNWAIWPRRRPRRSAMKANSLRPSSGSSTATDWPPTA